MLTVQWQKTNYFASRQYWAQPHHYEFFDRSVILWNRIASKFAKIRRSDWIKYNPKHYRWFMEIYRQIAARCSGLVLQIVRIGALCNIVTLHWMTTCPNHYDIMFVFRVCTVILTRADSTCLLVSEQDTRV